MIQKTALKSIEIIRNAGIDEIDFDLIRGLPDYTPKLIVEDLNFIEKIDVPSVTSYQYSIKPHSLDFRRDINGNYDEKVYLLMQIIFSLGMKKLGYMQKPIDWFIKGEKHVYRHQMLKWKYMSNQLALGQSSYGYINGTQFSNFSSMNKYRHSINSGELPIEKSTNLPDEEVIRRGFIFGLKTGIDRKEFKKIHGIDPTETSFKNILALFINVGAISISDTDIGLTEAGSLYADFIQMAFYSNKYK